MVPIGWRAWYTQGRVFDSTVYEWAELPKEGVLVIIVFFDEKSTTGENYKEILQGRRRYFKAVGSSGNVFYKGTLWNEAKILRTYDTSEPFVKEGIWDDDASMEAAVTEAMHSSF